MFKRIFFEGGKIIMEKNEGIVDGISEVIGSGIGAGIGLLMAGPVGAIGGAIVSPVITNMIKWCIRESKEKHYSSREEKNIGKVISYANAECVDDNKSEADAFDEDWFARFINITKDIRSENLQIIWGKILAKEINKHGSVSLRTLDVLKNISSEEAGVFQSLLPFVITIGDDVSVLPANKEIQKKYNIFDGNYILMDSCGLMQMISHTSITEMIKAEETRRRIRTKERLLSVINPSDSEKKFNINDIYLLTRSGKELFDILFSEPDNDFFEDWVRQLANVNKSSCLRFEIHQRTSNKNGLYYTPEPIVVLE